MKNNPHLLRVGQEVFLETPSYRDKEPNKITVEKISKIGDKFFYLENSDSRYFNNSLKQDGDSPYLGYVYPTKFLLEQSQTRAENIAYVSEFCRKFSATSNNEALQALKNAMVKYKESALGV